MSNFLRRSKREISRSKRDHPAKDIILSSNKSGVETGALAAALAMGVPFAGYTHKPNMVSELFKMKELPRMFDVTMRLIQEADKAVFIGYDGNVLRKLRKRLKGRPLVWLKPSEIDLLQDVPISGRVYITGLREHQYEGIADLTFKAMKRNLGKNL